MKRIFTIGAILLIGVSVAVSCRKTKWTDDGLDIKTAAFTSGSLTLKDDMNADLKDVKLTVKPNRAYEAEIDGPSESKVIAGLLSNTITILGQKLRLDTVGSQNGDGSWTYSVYDTLGMKYASLVDQSAKLKDITISNSFDFSPKIELELVNKPHDPDAMLPLSLNFQFKLAPRVQFANAATSNFYLMMNDPDIRACIYERKVGVGLSQNILPAYVQKLDDYERGAISLSLIRTGMFVISKLVDSTPQAYTLPYIMPGLADGAAQLGDGTAGWRVVGDKNKGRTFYFCLFYKISKDVTHTSNIWQQALIPFMAPK